MKAINILLIEDNLGDVELVKTAIKENKFKNNLFVCNDGEKGLKFLFKEDEYLNQVTPDLILLDLNLPKIEGKDVLAKIKGNETLRSIPVVILTTSSAEADVLKSYNLNANCYITKPIDLNKFIEVIKSIEIFWLSIVKLPTVN